MGGTNCIQQIDSRAHPTIEISSIKR
jgi:hypothetical protein